MAQQRQGAGNQPEQANRGGGEGRDAFGHQRIGGPDERCRRCGNVAPGQRATQFAAAHDGNRCAAKPQQGRHHMRHPQRHAGQHHRGQHHDEQGPQVVDEVGLHRRRMPQRDEQQKVVRKQTIDTQRQRAHGNAPLRWIAQHKGPGRHAADDERDAGEQEGWNVRERHAQRGERGPQGDGAQGVEIGLQGRRRHAPTVCVLHRTPSSCSTGISSRCDGCGGRGGHAQPCFGVTGLLLPARPAHRGARRPSMLKEIGTPWRSLPRPPACRWPAAAARGPGAVGAATR